MLENVFSGATVYGEGWSVVNSRAFNDDEKSLIKSNSVVNSKYGKSVCFFMKAGGQVFFPLGKFSDNVEVGSSIDLDKAKWVELHRTGDANIIRVEA